MNIAASVERFVNLGCGELPPHPPGWDEWWQRHRAEVAKAIEEAQATMRRTLLHKALICLEEHGLLPTSKVELVPTGVVREILGLLDEDKDEKTHLRLMGGPPAPHNECGGPGDLHAEEPVKVTCKACRDTVGFARAIANEAEMKAMKAEADAADEAVPVVRAEVIVRHELACLEECSLANTNGQCIWNDGYDRAICTCGWKSCPIKRDKKALIELFKVHVMTSLRS